MNLPRDIIIHILSFLDNSTIRKILVPYDYYKQYLIFRNIKNKPESYYRGVYNNLYNNCFTCRKELTKPLYIMIICFSCEILLDDYCTYPMVCIDCIDCIDSIKNKKIIRGEINIFKCPSCIDNRMHIAVTSFS
jgi:hypothetical protein